MATEDSRVRKLVRVARRVAKRLKAPQSPAEGHHGDYPQDYLEAPLNASSAPPVSGNLNEPKPFEKMTPKEKRALRGEEARRGEEGGASAKSDSAEIVEMLLISTKGKPH